MGSHETVRRSASAGMRCMAGRSPWLNARLTLKRPVGESVPEYWLLVLSEMGSESSTEVPKANGVRPLQKG